MRRPSGTTHRRRGRSAQPAHARARIDLPEGWHSHKVRVANGIMIVNHEKLGAGRTGRIRRRACDLRRVAAERAEADHQMDDRRRRRAPLRFRRPLCLHLADRRGLCRQHRDDPRPRRSGEAAGGRALVDSRPVEGGRRALSVGRLGRRRAAIIRCASATGSMSATGTTACSFSTSPTCRSRRRSRTSTPARPFRTRPTPACASRRTLKGRDIMVVADEDVAKLWPVAARPSPGSTTSRTRRMPVPIATFQVPGLDSDGSAAAADDRLPSAVRALPRHASFRSPGSRRGCGWSTSPTRSRRRRSAIICPTRRRRGARLVQRRDHRRSRADLSGRPRPRRRHHRNQRIRLRIEP